LAGVVAADFLSRERLRGEYRAVALSSLLVQRSKCMIKSTSVIAPSSTLPWSPTLSHLAEGIRHTESRMQVPVFIADRYPQLYVYTLHCTSSLVLDTRTGDRHTS
jgi:hypothetical protein